MKKIKIYLSLSIFILLITSCQKQEVESIQEVNSTVNKNDLLKDFLENGQNGQFFSDFIKSDQKQSKTNTKSQKLNCSFMFGDNNLNNCSAVNHLGYAKPYPIWSVSDNGSGYIDYTLENFFNNHCNYSYFCYNPGGPVIQTMTGEVEFYESPTLEFDPELGDIYVYHYLNDESISIAKQNELLNHFICEMTEYRNTYMPNAWIVDIDFYGDALLCGSEIRYLKASFVMNLHSTGS